MELLAVALVFDLSMASCETDSLADTLHRFRDRRLILGLDTELRGLHPGVLPDPEAADLGTVFLAYRDARRRAVKGW